MILRSRFHCKNAGFEDLTKRILHFWFLGFPGNSGIIWVLIAFFLGCTFFVHSFQQCLWSILVLENVSWWYWGAGSTAKMQVLKTLQQGSYIFGFLGFPGNSGIIWVLMVLFSRLYILLCILSSNAFGHFGLGKCKLVILRCRFHCKNAGFEDLTTRILHFWFLGFPRTFWLENYMGFDAGFLQKWRLYILGLCILSSNAFGHFGLGKCKLVILRCRFHCKNAGFEDLTIGILHFWVPRIPWEFWYYMGFDWNAFFWSWRLYILQVVHSFLHLWFNAFGHFGLGKCKLVILRCRFHCKNAGFEDLTIGILHFWVPRIPWEFWYYMVFFLGFDSFQECLFLV